MPDSGNGAGARLRNCCIVVGTSVMLVPTFYENLDALLQKTGLMRATY